MFVGKLYAENNGIVTDLSLGQDFVGKYIGAVLLRERPKTNGALITVLPVGKRESLRRIQFVLLLRRQFPAFDLGNARIRNIRCIRRVQQHRCRRRYLHPEYGIALRFLSLPFGPVIRFFRVRPYMGVYDAVFYKLFPLLFEGFVFFQPAAFGGFLSLPGFPLALFLGLLFSLRFGLILFDGFGQVGIAELPVYLRGFERDAAAGKSQSLHLLSRIAAPVYERRYNALPFQFFGQRFDGLNAGQHVFDRFVNRIFDQIGPV